MTSVRVKINDILISVGQPQSKRDGGEGRDRAVKVKSRNELCSLGWQNSRNAGGGTHWRVEAVCKGGP